MPKIQPIIYRHVIQLPEQSFVLYERKGENMAGPIFERGEVETLLHELGIAININNGRCGKIEETLCKATTLCVELLAYFDECEPAVARLRLL